MHINTPGPRSAERSEAWLLHDGWMTFDGEWFCCWACRDGASPAPTVVPWDPSWRAAALSWLRRLWLRFLR